MRRKVFAFTLPALAALFIGACASAHAPVTGFIYSDVNGPLMISGNQPHAKTGTAECKSILGWVATGDCSIEAAMKNGGITKIATVDAKAYSVLGLYATFTIKVTGE